MFILTIALVLDYYIGDPETMWKYIKHPTVWFGKIIETVDQNRLGKDEDEKYGAVLIGVLAAVAVGVGIIVWGIGLVWEPMRWGVEIVIVGVLVAQKSMVEHTHRVAEEIRKGDIEKAREEVGKIVGRDVENADENKVSAASIESMAENFCDGVLAPVFWFAFFGIAGIVFYKAINTADSMIGKKDEKYRKFGEYAAKLDDALNYIPARLCPLIIAGASVGSRTNASFNQILKQTWQDGQLHPSPNAGIAQAAFASSLDIQLGGARRYQGEEINMPPFNATGRKIIGYNEINQAIRLFKKTCGVMIAICGGIAIISLI